MNKNIIITFSIGILIIGVSVYVLGNLLDTTTESKTTNNKKSSSLSDNPTIDVKTNIQVPATTVKVGTFYNGQDAYSLSIASGNNSICLWNYTGGSGAIPYIETTQAKTATEKHTLLLYGGTYDYKVNCFDDFGNQYVGIFPTERK
jgi:hypothetical protein